MDVKRRMTLLACALASWGLFAESASFEPGELGVAEDGETFVPDGVLWRGAAEALAVRSYSAAEPAFGYGAGALARRDEEFVGDAENLRYLAVEPSGGEALEFSPGGEFTVLDQLVRFEAFDQPPEFDVGATKIAVWSGDFNDEPGLYVSCGRWTGAGAEQANFRLEGDFAGDAWHRLTIVSLGEVASGEGGFVGCAGFVVYVDGRRVRVGADDPAYGGLCGAGDLLPEAERLRAERALFLAMHADDAEVRTVRYVGRGAIDDLVADDEGPAFLLAAADGWPADPSELRGQGACAQFAQLPTAFADADAAMVAVWAQGAGSLDYADCAQADIAAFLLGVANGDAAALAEARRSFVITGFRCVEGNWEAEIGGERRRSGERYLNGRIRVRRFADAACTEPSSDGRFFRAELIAFRDSGSGDANVR